MNFRAILLTLVIVFVGFKPSNAQNDTVTITLDDAIGLAQGRSLNAFLAKNTYLAGYWNFRSNYRSALYPSLNIGTTLLNYNKGYNRYCNAGTQEYENSYTENMYNAINMSLRQNLVYTGGQFSIVSSVNHNYNVASDNRSYKSIPIAVQFDQPLDGYNRFKWKRKIDPLEYERQKKMYITNQVGISRTTVRVFFDVLAAQIELKISEFNKANADTLYRIGAGRFEIGTITQDELLDLELTYLNAQNNLTKAKTNLSRAQNELNSFLRFSPGTVVSCLPPDSIPALKIELDQALDLSFENNPTIINYEMRMLEQDQNVAEKRSARFDANLYLKYGVTQANPEISEVYRPPFSDEQRATVGFNMPIIDWGGTRGNYLMAKSRREATYYQIEQDKIDFERNIVMTVLEYNLQEEQVSIAKKADEIGQLGFDVTKQRFLIGKVDVLKLNAARSSMENARKSYIRAMESYWAYYYNIQQLTLYDFLKKKSLEADFEKIVEDQKFGAE